MPLLSGIQNHARLSWLQQPTANNVRRQQLLLPPTSRITRRRFLSNNMTKRHHPTASGSPQTRLLTVTVIATGGVLAYSLAPPQFWNSLVGKATSSQQSSSSTSFNSTTPAIGPNCSFPPIAIHTRKLLQDYLSIVSENEQLDSLRRLQRLASTSSPADRQRVFAKEWKAIHDHDNTMSARNRKLLEQHLTHQQELVRLLTCMKNNDHTNNSTNKKNNEDDSSLFGNVCADLVGRPLSPEELQEAQRISHAELEALVEKAARLCEDCS